MHTRVHIFIAIFALLYSCNNSSKSSSGKGFEQLSSDQTGVDFVNTITNEKEFNIFRYRNFYNGGGVATGDINNDGLADLYFTSNQGDNQLYLNQGDFNFKNITKTANVKGNKKWSTGVVMVDINADGWLDIYVCNAGDAAGENRKNELFINNKDLTFTESAADYGLDHEGISTHAAFFDYDGDGDLDVYMLNNSFIPVASLNYNNKRELNDTDWDVPEILKGGGDKLLKNENGTFVDVTQEMGIYSSLIGFGLGVTVADFNNDQQPDIYVSNDFYERDYLYINQGKQGFVESLKETMPHISLSSMGADIADINNDGLQDVFVTDMLPEGDQRLKETSQFEGYDVYQRKLGLDFHHQFMQNTLQLNLNGYKTAEIANFAGVAKTDWSWGALLFDMDNDGYNDIFVSNGILNDLTNQDFMNFFANNIIQDMVINGKKEEVQEIVKKMPSTPIPNYAFGNNKDLTFNDNSKKWGLDEPSFSNGSSYADLDNDGDLDLVVNNINSKAFVYRNNSTNKNFIQIKLQPKSSQNTFGIGSKVELYTDNEILNKEIIPSRGFQSSVAYRVHFGIADRKIDSAVIYWPSGSQQVYKDLKINQLDTIVETDYKAKPLQALPEPWLKFVNTPFPKHSNNAFNDFDFEGLVAQKLSNEVPAILVEDLNGDGLQDVILGGSVEQKPTLWLQNQSGFKETPLNLPKFERPYEITAITTLNANRDAFPDLLLGFGGNQHNLEYGTVLLINDGTGRFTPHTKQPTKLRANIAALAVYDYDNDGDEDVFVAARSVPNIYGASPKHQFLINDGNGNFTDTYKELFPDDKKLGMVTDATWVQLSKEKHKSLVVIQDWGPAVKIDFNKGSTQQTELYQNSSGWGRSVSVADVNKDGLKDLLVGYTGSNSPYVPTTDNPMHLWVRDFDNNTTIEQIITHTVNDKQKPVQTKHKLASQIVSLQRGTQKFTDYAQKSLQELLDPTVLGTAEKQVAYTATTVLLLNNGKGGFTRKELPPQANFSSTHDAVFYDFNADGNLDLFMGGNDYDFRPQFTQLDSSYGWLFTGDGKGNFRPRTVGERSVPLYGELREIHPIFYKNKAHFLVSINNEYPVLLACEN